MGVRGEVELLLLKEKVAVVVNCDGDHCCSSSVDAECGGG